MCDLCDLVFYTVDSVEYIDEYVLRDLWTARTQGFDGTKVIKHKYQIYKLLDKGYMLYPTISDSVTSLSREPEPIPENCDWELCTLDNMYHTLVEFKPKTKDFGFSVYNELKNNDKYVEVFIKFPGINICRFIMSRELAKDKLIQLYDTRSPNNIWSPTCKIKAGLRKSHLMEIPVGTGKLSALCS